MTYGDLTIIRTPGLYTVYQRGVLIGTVARKSAYRENKWYAYDPHGRQVGEKPHKTALAGAWALRG